MKQIVNKGEFIKNIPEEQFKAGQIKFNIPDEEQIYSKNGEGVWGWVTPEDKRNYDDDTFNGKIKAVLLNSPLNYFGRLVWGAEVVLQCHGAERPTLDPEWVTEYLMS